MNPSKPCQIRAPELALIFGGPSDEVVLGSVSDTSRVGHFRARPYSSSSDYLPPNPAFFWDSNPPVTRCSLLGAGSDPRESVPPRHRPSRYDPAPLHKRSPPSPSVDSYQPDSRLLHTVLPDGGAGGRSPAGRYPISPLNPQADSGNQLQAQDYRDARNSGAGGGGREGRSSTLGSPSAPHAGSLQLLSGRDRPNTILRSALACTDCRKHRLHCKPSSVPHVTSCHWCYVHGRKCEHRE